MARFAVGGDEDENEDRPTNRPLPKRPRITNTIISKRPRITNTIISKRPVAAASNSRGRLNTSAAAPQPQIDRITPPDKRVMESEQSTDDSETSWSDPVSDSSTEESSEEEEDVQQQPTPRTGDVVQPAEERADPTASGSDAGREPKGSSGSVTVTLTDPDVLDCPICYEPLCSPVYQCENGHIACASCCTTMKNKCASCCWPIGYNRCRAIEKVLESVRISCRNMPHGCMQKFSYSKKLAHEKICTYAAISCPHTGCDFSSFYKFVYQHFALKHSQSSKQFSFNEVISLSLDKNQKHVFLQEKNQNTVFILNQASETVGSFVNVVCVAPTTAKKAYLYELTATLGESSVRLKSVVDVMPKWMAQLPTKLYLLVPKDFISVSGVMKLEFKIWRNIQKSY